MANLGEVRDEENELIDLAYVRTNRAARIVVLEAAEQETAAEIVRNYIQILVNTGTLQISNLNPQELIAFQYLRAIGLRVRSSNDLREPWGPYKAGAKHYQITIPPG